ncbi:MAG: HlyC/CorC family transporter [Deltaproteobacteria bacterium]|nr:HlyC/CorC family transporter [Deltaproteobacteria bacterium]
MEEDPSRSVLARIKSLIGRTLHRAKGSDLAEELQDLMNEGRAKGLISGEETEMLHGVLDLKETQVYSIMIPRTEVSSSSINSTLGEIIHLVSTCGHTRIPICKESVDEIVGILHAKDLLKYWGQDPDTKIPPEILRPPYFVPRNQNVGELLKAMRAMKTHIAIVTDEYGGTAGIITIEDIIEEIVGEIQDEHDNDLPLLTTLEENTFVVDARLEVEKLEEHLGMKFPEGEFESVGGLLIQLMGKIPKPNERVVYQDLEMTVKSGDDRRIRKILVRRNPPPKPPAGENSSP